MDISGIQAELLKKRKEFAELKEQVLKAKKGLKWSQQRKISQAQLSSSTEQSAEDAIQRLRLLQDAVPNSTSLESKLKTLEPTLHQKANAHDLTSYAHTNVTTATSSHSVWTVTSTQCCEEKELTTAASVVEPDVADESSHTAGGAVTSRDSPSSSGCRVGVSSRAPASSSDSSSSQMLKSTLQLHKGIATASSVDTQECQTEASSPITCGFSREVAQLQMSGDTSSKASRVESSASTSKAVVVPPPFSRTSAILSQGIMASDFYLPDEGFGHLKLQKLQHSEWEFSSKRGKERPYILASRLLTVGERGCDGCSQSIVEVQTLPRTSQEDFSQSTCKSPSLQQLTQPQDPLHSQEVDQSDNDVTEAPLSSNEEAVPNSLKVEVSHSSPPQKVAVPPESGCVSLGSLQPTPSSSLHVHEHHSKCHVTCSETVEEGGRVTEVAITAKCSYHFQKGDKIISCSCSKEGSSGKPLKRGSLQTLGLCGNTVLCVLMSSAMSFTLLSLPVQPPLTATSSGSCHRHTYTAVCDETEVIRSTVMVAGSNNGGCSTGGEGGGCAVVHVAVAGSLRNCLVRLYSFHVERDGSCRINAEPAIIGGDREFRDISGMECTAMCLTTPSAGQRQLLLLSAAYSTTCTIGGATASGTASGSGGGSDCGTNKSVLYHWRLHCNRERVEVDVSCRLPLPNASTITSLVWVGSVGERGREKEGEEGEEGGALLVGTAHLTVMIWSSAVCELVHSVRLTCGARLGNAAHLHQQLIVLRAFQEMRVILLLLACESTGEEGAGLGTASSCWLLALLRPHAPTTADCFRAVKVYQRPPQMTSALHYCLGDGCQGNVKNLTHSAVSGSRACVWRLASSTPHRSFTFTGVPDLTAVTWIEHGGLLQLLALDSASVLHNFIFTT